MGARRVAPKGWGPEGWGPEGWGPEGWGAQNFALFLPFPATVSLFLCLSLWVFSWNFGGVLKRRHAQMYTFGFCGPRKGRSSAPNMTKPTHTRETPHHETVKQAPTPHRTHTHTTHNTTSQSRFGQSRFCPKSVLAKVGFKVGHDRQERLSHWSTLRSLEGAFWRTPRLGGGRAPRRRQWQLSKCKFSTSYDQVWPDQVWPNPCCCCVVLCCVLLPKP